MPAQRYAENRSAGHRELPALKEGKSGGVVVTNRVADAILSADPYRPKVILSYWNNFNFSAPETKRWDEPLKQVEFFAHAVTHYSEMSHFADLLLPATFHLGEQRSSLQMVGNTYTQLWYGERIVDPVYDCKNPETAVMWLLAEKLAERGFTNFLDYLRNEFRDPQTGNHGTQFNSWNEFVEAGLWTSGDYNFGGLWSNMPTETGKFEFYSETLKKALRQHADRYDTDIDDVVIASNYPDATGERAFVAHYEQAYKHGEQNEYPFDFIDAKAMLNREGRSANAAASFDDFGNLQPRGANNNDIMPADYERLRGSTAFYGSFRVRVERA